MVWEIISSLGSCFRADLKCLQVPGCYGPHFLGPWWDPQIWVSPDDDVTHWTEKLPKQAEAFETVNMLSTVWMAVSWIWSVLGLGNKARLDLKRGQQHGHDWGLDIIAYEGKITGQALHISLQFIIDQTVHFLLRRTNSDHFNHLCKVWATASRLAFRLPLKPARPMEL